MTRRTPSMYAFYKRHILEAEKENQWDLYDYYIKDAPQEVKDGLIREGIIEGSVEQTRTIARDPYYEEVTRAVLVACLEENTISAWPDSRKVSLIANRVQTIMEKEDEGQPDWEQEWEDFGEVYDDEPNYL